jgi:hypothetical protein
MKETSPFALIVAISIPTNLALAEILVARRSIDTVQRTTAICRPLLSDRAISKPIASHNPRLKQGNRGRTTILFEAASVVGMALLPLMPDGEDDSPVRGRLRKRKIKHAKPVAAAVAA